MKRYLYAAVAMVVGGVIIMAQDTSGARLRTRASVTGTWSTVTGTFTKESCAAEAMRLKLLLPTGSTKQYGCDQPIDIWVKSALPADTTPPSVNLTGPTGTVSGSANVTATASDNVGVTGVQFKVDGLNLGVEDLSSPYSVAWSTTAVVNGAHVLTATARDAAGNTAASPAATVTVNNAAQPPPVACVVSAFAMQSAGAWGTCVGGQQTRTETWTRTVTTPPSNGGATCPVLSETRTGTQSCTVTPPHSNFSVGQSITPTTTINVRPSPAGTPILGTQPAGVVGVVVALGGSAVLDGTSYDWVNVNWSSGVDGYSGEDSLIPATAEPPPPTANCPAALSVGVNLASAVASAANGSTICLNAGNYGSVNFFNIPRTGFVTIRSASGVSARLSPQVGNSRFLRFQNVTLSSVLVNSCSLNIEFVGTPFAPNDSGLIFDASSCASSTHNYLVDGAIFDRVGMALYEGRLNCRDCNGVTIKNSTFSGIGSEPSDGIQTQGNTRNLTLSGNRFSGILESLCGATHCDAIQLQGGGTTLLSGNLFENGDTFIMSPDGCNAVTATNNIFNGSTSTYDFKLQFGSCSNLTFTHNTLKQAGVAIDSKSGQPASSNALVRDNIFAGQSPIKTSGGNGCSGCTVTGNLTATPTYVGGVTPSTWPGWALAAGSPGKGAASDGKDQGATTFGPTP